VDGEALATAVLLSGVGCWIAINWACRSIFVALEALRVGAIADFSVLSSRALSLQEAHSVCSAYLSFLLWLVVWKWFPRLEQRSEDPSRVRLLKWATVVVAFMIVATAVVPRRFLWDKFELVAFENQRAFVVGAHNDELLLYSPEGGQRKRWRVPRDAAGLQRTGATGRLFDLQ
jgi:hypothetical protein